MERGRPGCPQDNGAHERLHLDIRCQLQGAAYAERQAALDLWHREYNEERPHAAPQMRCPKEVYEDSPRRFEGTPTALVYEGMQTRTVQHNGHIAWPGSKVFLTTALRGWNIGIIHSSNGLPGVYFARMLLGQIEPSTAAFLRVIPSPKAAQRHGKTSLDYPSTPTHINQNIMAMCYPCPELDVLPMS